MCWLLYGLFDLAGGVWEYTTGNYVTGSGSAVDAYSPTNGSAAFVDLASMFSTDAVEYIPYFDVYPNPPISTNTDITTGRYGLGSSIMTSNTNWGIYANKLGLGQSIFEAAGWSGGYATSVLATLSWFERGGASASGTPSGIAAGVESLVNTAGGGGNGIGFRPLVLVMKLGGKS